MIRKEEERVEAERQRMRRLMSEGHISARELRAGKLFSNPAKVRWETKKNIPTKQSTTLIPKTKDWQR